MYRNHIYQQCLLLVTKTQKPQKHLQDRAYKSLKGKQNRYNRFLGDLGTQYTEFSEPSTDTETIDKGIDQTDPFKQAFSEEQKKRERIKRKIIERKYFKPPQEVNLLTWDGKEQIRYLVQEYPDEWTLDRIAESFPISREGVIKLLKSKRRMESLEEVIKHDKTVQKNWNSITDGEKAQGGPITLRYERLAADSRLRKLQFAAGNHELPMPKKKSIASGQPPDNANRKIGLFESMVKDYVEKYSVTKEESKQKEEAESLKQLQDENMDQLSAVTGQRKSQLLAAKKSQILKDINHTKMFKYRDALFTEGRKRERKRHEARSEYNTAQQETTADKTEHQRTKIGELYLYDSHVSPPSQSTENWSDWTSDIVVDKKDRLPVYKTERKASRESQSPAMRYKSKRANPSNRDAEAEEAQLEMLQKENEQTPNIRIQKYAAENRPGLQKVEYDYPFRSGKQLSKKEAYIYEPQSGYQHPYGKMDPELEDLDDTDVPQQAEDDPSKMLKKGKSYYDDDGEFLYRTP